MSQVARMASRRGLTAADNRGCVKTPDRNENGEQFSSILSRPTRNVEFARAVCLVPAQADGAGSKTCSLPKSELGFHTASTHSRHSRLWPIGGVVDVDRPSRLFAVGQPLPDEVL